MSQTAENPIALRPARRPLSERLMQPLTRLLLAASVLVSLGYFAWRIGETANPAAMWFFWLFLAAEMANFLESLLFYFTAWSPTKYARPPARPNRSVDVYITTYNEPAELLRETVVCALSITYPHRTYILDDGARPEIAELARELDCEYIARSDRRHAKAGNLNHALVRTDGDFIVTLDADHIAAPDLIDQLIGFFDDPRVAVVQTAQDFYNLDSFQHVTDRRARYGWQQQELFFSVIQPGKDRYNAAFYCGSPAILRRAALEDVGGFATETITEDMHTGLRLQKKGWRVVYHNRTVAWALAPQTFTGFAMQWYRWGHGAMQVLWRENPLFTRGLGLAQRICYFASFYFYWMSYQKLLYVLTPIFCLLTGLFPLVARPYEFALYFGPYFLLNLASSSVLQGGLRSFLLSEKFNMLKMHVLMKTVAGLFRKEGRFSVTPKARAGAAHWRDLWPQLLILAVTGGAVAAGLRNLLRATTDYEFWAFTVNLFWALSYLLLTVPVVRSALTRRELRSSYRFPGRLDVRAHLDFQLEGGPPVRERNFVRNLNRFGFSVTRAEPIPVGTFLDLHLKVGGHDIPARGCVMWARAFDHRGHRRMAHGVRFVEIAARDQDEISRYLFCEIAPSHARLMRLTHASQAPRVQPQPQEQEVVA